MTTPLTPPQTRRLIARSRMASAATDPMEVQYLLRTTTDQLECLNDLREREYRRVMDEEANPGICVRAPRYNIGIWLSEEGESVMGQEETAA